MCNSRTRNPSAFHVNSYPLALRVSIGKPHQQTTFGQSREETPSSEFVLVLLFMVFHQQRLVHGQL